MTINIENGQDIIDILSDGFVTCLKIRKPIAIDWDDCAGSAGKYYCFTPDYEPVVEQFNEVLISGDDHQILSTMVGFLELFCSGQYNVYIDRNSRTEFELHFQFERSSDTNSYNYGYYNSSGENAMFTQPLSAIDKDRVYAYQKMIMDGARPKAVLFQMIFKDEGVYDDGSRWIRSVDSPLFILDGHHKLLAYKNLKIDPEYVLISREVIGQPEFTGKGKDLYFGYEYFLSDHSRQHIISQTPKLLVNNSPEAVKYNAQLDHYLETTRTVDANVLELFRQAWQSREREKLIWLRDRLDVVEQKVGLDPKMKLHYLEFTPQYPMGAWNGMNVQTTDDYRAWIKKLLGNDLEEMRNAFSQ